MAHHVIFILGFGDQRAGWLIRLIKTWQKFGIEPEIQQMGWADGKDFVPKLNRITDKINYLTSQGNTVSLVGISAGASAALNAYSIDPSKIRKIAFVSGKLNNPQTVNPRYYTKNPAFKESLNLAQNSLKKLTNHDKSKMLSVHGRYDALVPIPEGVIPGVNSKYIFSVGHLSSIIFALTIHRKAIINFLKT